MCNFAAQSHIMRKLSMCLSLVFMAIALKIHAQTALQRPRLIVGIVVDQMRWDYLYRYFDRYSGDGFKRMMNEGFNCQNTFINYLPSFTAPGHACVYTGTVPAIHGIAANDWMEVKTGTEMYCVEDKTVTAVGGSLKAAQMSPANLLTTTITDELKLATNKRSKVYGISIKDRGSILPAGHLADGAFWFDDSTGNFISSSYYGSSLPGWMATFNNKRYADSLINTPWELLYPANTYAQSLDDNNAYEGKFPGETAPVFPHSMKGTQNKGYGGLRTLPGGNEIIFRAAKACVNGTDLGKDGITDFLCLSFSSTDYAGHMFAPNAVEMEDMFLRFDEDMAGFLSYLDKKVGKGNYTVFLTADHGAAHNPTYLKDMKVPAGVMSEGDARKKMNAFLKTKFGKDSIIKAAINYQLYLNEEIITDAALDRGKVKKTIIQWLQEQDGIAFVADIENMADAAVPEPLKTMIINGYHKDRSGTIQIVYEPGWYSGSRPTGTTHGTWNPYDTHIPLLWYGWGIPQGETYRTVHMTDIAPTLAALLHVQMPNGCTGEVIKEIMK